MKVRIVVLGVLSVALTGCINLPQTKALITPVGVVGVHSFGPPRQLPRNIDPKSVDFEQPRIAQHTPSEFDEQS
jgi:hypothetical protein